MYGNIVWVLVERPQIEVFIIHIDAGMISGENSTKVLYIAQGTNRHVIVSVFVVLDPTYSNLNFFKYW